MGVRDAYQKMFEDGTAYKPIKIEQPSPQNEQGRAMGHMNEPDLNLFSQDKDRLIEEAKRRKEMKEGKKQKPVMTTKNTTSTRELRMLTQRVEILEQALKLVMETQTKILKESYNRKEEEIDKKVKPPKYDKVTEGYKPEENGESIETETA